MQKTWASITGAIALVLGIPLVVFYFALGPDAIFDRSIWLPMVSSLVVLGAIGWLIWYAGGKLIGQSEAKNNHWEITRLAGKWRYVFTLCAQISLLIVGTLVLAYFFTDRSQSESGVPLLVALGLLVIITLGGSFLFSLQLWKVNEHQFQTGRSDPDDTGVL